MTGLNLLPHQQPEYRDKYIVLTEDQVEDIVEGAVMRTRVHLGLSGSSFRSGRIYRQEMIDILGSIRKFEKARATGRLKTFKDGPRNSKVWSRREDFEKFLSDHTNRRI